MAPAPYFKQWGGGRGGGLTFDWYQAVAATA